jgi:hypothetical protein
MNSNLIVSTLFIFRLFIYLFILSNDLVVFYVFSCYLKKKMEITSPQSNFNLKNIIFKNAKRIFN